MNITLSLGDFLMIAAIFLLFSRSSFAYFAGSSRQELRMQRMQRQLDAIMKHLGLPEPIESAPGALSPQVLALLAAGQRIGAIQLYRQETGAGLKQAKKAIEQATAASTTEV